MFKVIANLTTTAENILFQFFISVSSSHTIWLGLCIIVVDILAKREVSKQMLSPSQVESR